MGVNVLMPQLGETVSQGTVLAWLKSPGERVEAGDALFEVETDKTSMEVQSLASGVLAEVRVPAGATVDVGAVVAVIAATGAATIPAAAAAETPDCALFDAVRSPTESYGPAMIADGMRITPLARRLVAQNGIDVARVAAAVRERGGSIVRKADVLMSAVDSTRRPAPVTPLRAVARFEPDRADAASVVPLGKIRQATGRHLAEAWRTAPHVLQAIEIDFESVASVRAQRKAAFTAAHGVPLTYLPFIARAVCVALQAFPQVNARYDGDRLVLSRDVNLGIAVDLGADGLVVPVVHRAQFMNLAGLATAIDGLAQKARGGRLSPADVDAGTYSISNNGTFGTLFTAPIINTPQVAILSTDAITKRPVVKETPVGDVIVIRHVGIVAQSFDHRAFDGATSAAYLARLKQIIETHDWLSELG